MLPGFPIDNQANVRFANLVFICYVDLLYSVFGKHSNAPYIFFDKFSIPLLNALYFVSSVGSSFFGHVFHVVFMSSKPKMFRVTTKPIVARMAHAYSMMTWAFWNQTFSQNPSKPMGFPLFSLVFEHPITVACSFSPIPTGPSLINLFPIIFGRTFLTHTTSLPQTNLPINLGIE